MLIPSFPLNLPTSFSFQPLWGGLQIICLFACRSIPHLPPCPHSELHGWQRPANLGSPVGSTGDRRAGGRQRQCISPLCLCSDGLLGGCTCSLALALWFQVPHPHYIHMIPASTADPSSSLHPLTLGLAAASHNFLKIPLLCGCFS